MPEIKLYTIADLRSWLIDNNAPLGLTERVIAPVRAYAILNNPYVKDEDAVVATIYEGDELAAFTACFPEVLNHQSPITNHNSLNRIWWASTLWCNPQFQGKGYGLIVVGSLMEAHEGEVTLDRWGAKETVEIFRCLGYNTIYTNRYRFGDKAINRTTLKGKFAYAIQECIKSFHRCMYQSPITNHKYLLKYSTFVDGEAYAFMQEHRGNDLFLREQQMLNWILRYPFKQSCVANNRVEKDTEFTANVNLYNYWVVKVFQDNTLIGVYILRRNDCCLSVVYLYYEGKYEELVFASIVEHILKLKTNVFATENKVLADFVQHYVYFPKKSIEQISFSCPSQEDFAPYTNSIPYIFQFGEGDSFA